jgi:hypothetical protein
MEELTSHFSQEREFFLQRAKDQDGLIKEL